MKHLGDNRVELNNSNSVPVVENKGISRRYLLALVFSGLVAGAVNTTQQAMAAPVNSEKQKSDYDRAVLEADKFLEGGLEGFSLGTNFSYLDFGYKSLLREIEEIQGDTGLQEKLKNYANFLPNIKENVFRMITDSLGRVNTWKSKGENLNYIANATLVVNYYIALYIASWRGIIRAARINMIIGESLSPKDILFTVKNTLDEEEKLWRTILQSFGGDGGRATALYSTLYTFLQTPSPEVMRLQSISLARYVATLQDFMKTQ